jgi:hypothetical protein
MLATLLEVEMLLVLHHTHLVVVAVVVAVEVEGCEVHHRIEVAPDLVALVPRADLSIPLSVRTV